MEKFYINKSFDVVTTEELFQNELECTLCDDYKPPGTNQQNLKEHIKKVHWKYAVHATVDGDSGNLFQCFKFYLK